MRSKKTISRSTAALLIIVCAVSIFFILRGDRGAAVKNDDAIRASYAGYAMTFPAGAAYDSLSALLDAADYEEITSGEYTYKNYDVAAFVPYLPQAETISAVQSSPFNSDVVTYVMFSNEKGEEFVQCYKNDRLSNQTVYDPETDCAYEITGAKVKVYEDFRANGTIPGTTSIFGSGGLFGK